LAFKHASFGIVPKCLKSSGRYQQSALNAVTPDH